MKNNKPHIKTHTHTKTQSKMHFHGNSTFSQVGQEVAAGGERGGQEVNDQVKCWWQWGGQQQVGQGHSLQGGSPLALAQHPHHLRHQTHSERRKGSSTEMGL